MECSWPGVRFVKMVRPHYDVVPKQATMTLSEALPSFKKPPVVETAISVQFKPLAGFRNAHLGLFWNALRETYPKVTDAEPIPPQVERFGVHAVRGSGLPTFRIGPAEAAARLQMISEDDQTMVQLQNGRLVFNWRRAKDGAYPRWHKVLPQFKAALKALESFLTAQGWKGVEPNQWEVTYVNHLPKGRDWHEPADWPKLLPGLIGTATEISSGTAESIGCNFRFVLPENSGRLHVELFHGFTSAEQDAAELLVLQLTARGGVDQPGTQRLFDGLETGHRAIVRTFTEVTGPEAHEKEHWERER